MTILAIAFALLLCGYMIAYHRMRASRNSWQRSAEEWQRLYADMKRAYDWGM